MVLITIVKKLGENFKRPMDTNAHGLEFAEDKMWKILIKKQCFVTD